MKPNSSLTVIGALRVARRLGVLLPAGAICAVSLLVAACGDGSSTGAAAVSNAAEAGAGAASAPTAIVAKPKSGPCPPSGASATQAADANPQLDCAP
jgi:hypothetical protein